MHGGLRLWVGDLNRVLREEKALHELDFDPAGFQWIDVTDADHSVVSLIRRGRMPDDIVVARLQLHAGAAAQLPDRHPVRRAVGRDAQQRRAPLRRQRAGQPRRRRGGAGEHARPLAQRHPDPAPAGSAVPQTRDKVGQPST